MIATSIHNTSTTNNAGFPPAPPEAHQRADELGANTLSTHQVVRLAMWIDAIEAKQRVYRRCAVKAADMGKRVQAMYWSNWAMKAESVVARLRRRLNAASPSH